MDTHIAIVFEDASLVIINKPVGVIVNRANSVKTETVQDWVEEKGFLLKDNGQETEEMKEFFSRSGIVHRIDKETSGILLIAKTVEAFFALKKQFMERTVKKTYLALVHGEVSSEGTINAPIGRLPWNQEHFGVLPGGKESVTKYKRLKMYDGGCKNDEEKISLVEVYPQTGRTHQIRVHFKYIGHPLVGDYLYAGRKTARDDREDVGRVMLHAWKISFLHPITGQPLAFEAPIPDDMKRVFD